MDYSNLKIAVFGGSKPTAGEVAYQQAYDLGKMLGNLRATVMTGGYMGTMEAISRGVVEAGGRSIGVTCDEIETWRQASANQWVQKEIRCMTLMERISTMMNSSQAIIVLPGGVGTLTELAIVWNHLLIQAITPHPLILVGPAWKSVLTAFLDQFKSYISEGQFKLITFAPDIQAAIESLDNWFQKLHSEVTQ